MRADSKLLKPWNIVFVTMPQGRTFIGELVSFPTPDGSIMIRQVPGIAATLLEIPVSAVERLATGFHWVHYAEIRGKGDIPLDMLRYDSAVPFNFTIDEETGAYKLDEGQPEDTPLIVASLGRYKFVPPFTPKRWESFGWRCDLIKVARVDTTGTELSA